jgi:SAM-dependent methyltransferase
MEAGVNKDMQAYYARRAAEYDRIYDKPERQADLARLKVILSDHFSGIAVLEIACGTGYWTQIIAGTARAILATDYNREMLKMAGPRDYGDCRVRFEIADAYDLSQITRPQEAAFAGFLWSHIPINRRPDLISALHACLAEGAPVVWIDNRYVAGSSTPIARRDEDGNTYQVRPMADGSRHEIVKNYPGEADLRADFAPRADNIAIQLFQYYWLLSYNVKK